ncbi:MAG: hypothetical protein PHE79_07725 [Eubacteriales bacterium]|nr:hypothetical protein [Eubacteriales bacterium]
MKHNKADEMEMAINFKAMRLSWVFVTVVLLGWVVCVYAQSGEFLFIPFSIVCIQTIIFFSSKLIITHRMTDGNHEE